MCGRGCAPTRAPKPSLLEPLIAANRIAEQRAQSDRQDHNKQHRNAASHGSPSRPPKAIILTTALPGPQRRQGSQPRCRPGRGTLACDPDRLWPGVAARCSEARKGRKGRPSPSRCDRARIRRAIELGGLLPKNLPDGLSITHFLRGTTTCVARLGTFCRTLKTGENSAQSGRFFSFNRLSSPGQSSESLASSLAKRCSKTSMSPSLRADSAVSDLMVVLSCSI